MGTARSASSFFTREAPGARSHLRTICTWPLPRLRNSAARRACQLLYACVRSLGCFQFLAIMSTADGWLCTNNIFFSFEAKACSVTGAILAQEPFIKNKTLVMWDCRRAHAWPRQTWTPIWILLPFGGLWPRCHFSEPQLPDSCKAEATPPLSQGYQQGVNEIMNAKYLSIGSK